MLSDPLWIDDVAVLLGKQRWKEVWPTTWMTAPEVANALTRMGIAIGAVGILLQPSRALFFVAATGAAVTLIIVGAILARPAKLPTPSILDISDTEPVAPLVSDAPLPDKLPAARADEGGAAKVNYHGAGGDASLQKETAPRSADDLQRQMFQPIGQTIADRRADDPVAGSDELADRDRFMHFFQSSMTHYKDPNSGDQNVPPDGFLSSEAFSGPGSCLYASPYD